MTETRGADYTNRSAYESKITELTAQHRQALADGGHLQKKLVKAQAQIKHLESENQDHQSERIALVQIRGHCKDLQARLDFAERSLEDGRNVATQLREQSSLHLRAKVLP